MQNDLSQRRDTLRSRLREHARDVIWDDDVCRVHHTGEAFTLTDDEGLVTQRVAADEVGSVQLSRYRRARPRNWLRRLMRLAPATYDTVQIELRSSIRRFFTVESECSDTALLETLSWMDAEGLRVPLGVLARLTLVLMERETRIALGPLGPPPESLIRELSARLEGDLLELLQASPSPAAWQALVEALNAMEDEAIEASMPRIRTLLAAWPANTRRPPAAWLTSLSGGSVNPRLAAADLSILDLRNRALGDSGLKVLARYPFASGITHLNLNNNDLHDLNEGLDALAASPHLMRLVHLELEDNPGLGPRGAQALASIGTLEHLTLNRCGLGDAGAQALAQSSGLGNLERLELEDCDIGADGAAALAEAFPALRYLNLAHNGIGVGGARALAHSPLRKRLRWLDVSHAKLGMDGLAGIFGSESQLAGLRTLKLSGHRWEVETARVVRERRRLSRLKRLELCDCGLRTEVWEELTESGFAEAPPFPRLEHLVLRSNTLRGMGAEVFSKWVQLSTLTHLDMRECDMDLKAIDVLAASPHLGNLEELLLPERLVKQRAYYDVLAAARTLSAELKERLTLIFLR